MNALALRVRDELIADGIASVEAAYEDGSPMRTGALIGFRLCQALETPEEYQAVLAQRLRRELEDVRRGHAVNEGRVGDPYWEHRYATAQVEFVYNRLRVIWQLGPPYSGRAVVRVAEVLERITA